MALQTHQQFLETIKRSKTPLICVAQGAGPDGYGSALGIARVLQKLEKQPQIVAVEETPTKQISFLTDHGLIKNRLENLQQFVIELNAKETPVEELSYELKEDRLYVYLSPKKGQWSKEDIQLTASAFRYDLIIVIGANDLEACGHLYLENTEFFLRTPIINIDHSPSNEHFGQINAVDLTACACGEVCHDLIDSFEAEFIDEEVATAFLTGMIAKTKSFKHKNVTARTLQTASKLIAKGARRDMIVHHLYRTRSVETLRLWGRALARLKSDESINAVWTLLSQQDFLHAGAKEQDLPDVIDELLSTSPQAKIIIVLYEDAQKNACAIIQTDHEYHALQLLSPLNPTGNSREARLFLKDKHIVDAEKLILDTIRNNQKIQR